MTSKTIKKQVEYSPLWRRFLAIIYDVILLSAVVFCLFFLVLLVPKEAFSQEIFTLLRQIYLFGICYAYFALNWKYYRQTPGMRIWKLTLVSENKHPLSWRQVNIRFLSAIISLLFLAIGFIFALFNKERKCLHDLASTTALIH